MLAQVTKINKFTQSQVSALKKRLKALREQVRDAKDTKNNPQLTQARAESSSFACLATRHGDLAPAGHSGCIDSGKWHPHSAASVEDKMGACNLSCCASQEAKEIGDEFLALEKYVNLNYLVCLRLLFNPLFQSPPLPCRPHLGADAPLLPSLGPEPYLCEPCRRAVLGDRVLGTLSVVCARRGSTRS